jgi:hypothetical protein
MLSLPGSGFGSRARRSVVAGSATIFTAVALLWACGGSTGHQGTLGDTSDNQSTMDATMLPDADPAADAGGPYDAGLFDVGLIYANRPLPEAAAEGGGSGGSGDDGGSGVPSCPAWLPVDMSGDVLDAASDPNGVAFVPSYGGDDASALAEAFTLEAGAFRRPGGGTYQGVAVVPGAPVPAAGACATFDWFPQFDPTCIISNDYNSGAEPYSPYPPCDWATGLGKAKSGPGSGESRYDLCMSVYTCAQQSGCWTSPFSCLCGPPDDSGVGACLTTGIATGPCKDQIFAGFEVAKTDLGTIQSISLLYNTEDSSSLLAAGIPGPPNVSVLMKFYYTALEEKCVVPQDAGAPKDASSD